MGGFASVLGRVCSRADEQAPAASAATTEGRGAEDPALQPGEGKEAGGPAYSKEESLCEAALDGRLRDVRRFLDRGADVNYTDPDGRSVLISAFDLGITGVTVNLEVVKLLLERGADVNAYDSFGWTPLHYAICLDDVSRGRCVDLCISAGADVNSRDRRGATPLHWAAFTNREEVVRALLAAGADRDLRGYRGRFKKKKPSDLTTRDAVRDLLRQ